MRTILVFGAGKSTPALFRYFYEQSQSEQLHIVVVDRTFVAVPKLFRTSDRFTFMELDLFKDKDTIVNLIENSAIVVSMLPPQLHIVVAEICLKVSKNLVTASYCSDAMYAMEPEVKEKGLLFLNEVGLDPGIDHMSAMSYLDEVRARGGNVLLFESFCGGLPAPESDTNVWNYKFTWNPRNVVLAGQGGTAKFIQEGTYKYIPYHKLFRRTEFLEIEGYGTFEAYANRDSLKYQSVYGLNDVLTLYRGTIRRVGFSRAWNLFVQLGMTDDTYTIANSKGLSYRDFLNLFLAYSPTDSVELKLRHYLKIDQDDVVWQKLVWLDLFSEQKKIGIANGSPAQILQEILEANWKLQPEDKDMIVMYHKFGYEEFGVKNQIDAHLVVLGEDSTYTAMAKTVGLPLGIATMLILNKKVTVTGVKLPVIPQIYKPILNELERYGVVFQSFQVPYMGYNPNNVFG